MYDAVFSVDPVLGIIFLVLLGLIAAVNGVWSAIRIFSKRFGTDTFWGSVGRRIKTFLLVMSSLGAGGVLACGLTTGQFIFPGNIGIAGDGPLQKPGFYLFPPEGMIVLPLSDEVQVKTRQLTQNGQPLDPFQDIVEVSVRYRVSDPAKLFTLYPGLKSSGSLKDEITFQLLPILEEPENFEKLENILKELDKKLGESGIDAHIRVRHSKTHRIDYGVGDAEVNLTDK